MPLSKTGRRHDSVEFVFDDATVPCTANVAKDTAMRARQARVTSVQVLGHYSASQNP
jgi:hypothetical protein